MRYFELCEAKITVRNKVVMVVPNPPWPRLHEMWENAVEKQLRGLIVGNRIWWADAHRITHGDLAEEFDSNYPNYDVDNRVMIEDDGGNPVLDYSELRILEHPMLQRYLHEGLLLSVPGMGITTYDAFFAYTNKFRKVGEADESDTLDLPTIEKGDTVLVGKFKNRKAEIKGFTTDQNNQPVLKTTKGDQKLFKPRIAKLMP